MQQSKKWWRKYMRILIINGPNLNFLGIREVNIYGKNTYRDLCQYLKKVGKEKHIHIDLFQSNHEGKIIDRLQKAYKQKYDGIIINPGALTHYSYALYDAIKAINIKTVEVHLSDINAREEFRKKSVISDACVATFMSKNFASYEEAIMYFIGE
jgi:3-dehydroquinate dehydratase-2